MQSEDKDEQYAGNASGRLALRCGETKQVAASPGTRALEVEGGGATGWRMRKEVLETQGSPGWRWVHKETPDKQGW